MTSHSAISDALNVYGGGQLLAFSGLDGPTDFDNGLVARTIDSRAGIDIKLPGECRLVFSDQPPADVLLGGDFFRLQMPGGATRGAFLDARHLLIEGPCIVQDCSDAISVVQRDGRTLVGSTAGFEPGLIDADLDAAFEARRCWLEQVALPPRLDDARRRTLIKCLSVMKTQVCTPTHHVRHRWTTPDRWPHRGLWLWDSAFHAIGWRHVDPQLARDMLLAVFDGQRDDGQVPIRTVPGGGHEYTQPPVLTLATMMLDRADSNREFLEQIYPMLARYVLWDLTNRDTSGDGLCEWAIEGNPGCRSGESGMDNSPRFDSAAQLDATDFNSFLSLECEVLSMLAHLLDKPAEAGEWLDRHLAINDRMNELLWSDEHGLYVDYDPAAGRQTGVLASSGFLPLICGAASQRQAERLAEHLRDARTFATAVPVPSIAACDTASYSQDMWRGPMWVNLNWLIAMGLDRYEMADAAAELRRKTMREIERWYGECGAIYEYFDDRGLTPPPKLNRKGKCAPHERWLHQVIHDYGWTAALYADMAME